MFARYTAQGLTCRIIDKRSAGLDNGELERRVGRRVCRALTSVAWDTQITGQADGLNCRTLEIFESLGFVESIEKEGSRMVSRFRDVGATACR